MYLWKTQGSVDEYTYTPQQWFSFGIPRPARAASRNFQKGKLHWAALRPTGLEPLGESPAICVLLSLPGYSDACSSLRTTVLEYL